MAFAKLDAPLEDKLREITEGYEYGDLVDMRRGPETDELERLGYIEQVAADCSGNVCVRVPYKGLRYFDQKREWHARIRELATAETDITADDFDVLEVIAEKFLEGNGGPVGPQYPTSDKDRMASIRKLDRLGYLKVFYADDGPYLVSVTIDGLKALAGDDEEADEPVRGTPLAERIAGILGSFTGAAAREFSDI